MKTIVTIPPYADFIGEVARHPMVCGLRLNTVMPIKGSDASSYADMLRRLSQFGQPLWVDLKGRQLRVVGAAIPPYTEVKVSHRVQVDTPAPAYFSDGREYAEVVAVDGDRLILGEGPRRLIGPGESVNIVHPSLRIEGTLTDTDRAYLSAMRELGLRHVMLSFAEQTSDIDEVKTLLPNAELVLKIESQRGLTFVRQHKASLGRLMAARGDLYVEVARPHHIIRAAREVAQADPNAIVASRILESLAHHPVPSCADMSDVAFLLSAGYRTFMLGDTICQRRHSVIEALNVLQSFASEL
ncbi:MAG: pyruvate kinase [Anaerolineae bacterium]|nr:pyruvate kinase [Anaerolineae bacterium]